MTDLPKAYDFRSTEERFISGGRSAVISAPSNDPNKPGFDPTKKPFVISIPPPNVTGELHLGHALFVSMEDLMIRYHRMKGEPLSGCPARDHAGIATQMQVEKAPGQRRAQPARKLAVRNSCKRTWEWKEKYGGIISNQIRRLGASCDWDRTRFTLDEGLSKAVREAFVTPVRKGVDLSRPAHDQLVARLADGRLRPGSGIFRGTRYPVLFQIYAGR